ncbi:hypothetical protein D3C81_1935510 [compost metagenome]
MLITSSIRFFTSFSSVTLQRTKVASPPAVRISATVPSPPAVSMSATTTFRPSAANAWAVARPMPAAAPVTTATWPENVMLIVMPSEEKNAGSCVPAV